MKDFPYVGPFKQKDEQCEGCGPNVRKNNLEEYYKHCNRGNPCKSHRECCMNYSCIWHIDDTMHRCRNADEELK